MLAATLIQNRTKSPSHKGGVDEEVEGSEGEHSKPENHSPGSCDSQGRMLAASALMWNRASLVYQGDTQPLLSGTLARDYLFSLSLREERCLSLYPSCCY